ncbi:MAG: KGGVGR-motif variant AAA ATPase [Candidatus Omnitrophota bacterium]
MIFTFYSYKGGVGRSMALANTAELFFRSGKKVLIVDWDLEAPGLERYFFKGSNCNSVIDTPGLMDIILSYKKKIAEKLDSIESLKIKRFIIDVHQNSPFQGKLFLLHAGKRLGNSFAKYAREVLNFDWGDFYENWEGEIFFEWMREQFESIAEIILIDSRTGVTEMTGICTYQMAGTVIMFCAPNQQNIDGTYNMAMKFSSPEIAKLRQDRPLNILIVPSRVEDRSEVELLNVFRTQFIEKFNPFFLRKPINGLDSYWDLKIPYISYYSFNETLAVNEESQSYSEDIAGAFIKLSDIMAEITGYSFDFNSLIKIRKYALNDIYRSPKNSGMRSLFYLMKDDDWDSLIYSIRKGNCILMLGPDASTEIMDGQYRKISEILANHLVQGINLDKRPEINPNELLQVSRYYNMERGRAALEINVCNFYSKRSGTSSSFYHDIAALPFYLTINIAHDNMFVEALKTVNKNPIVGWYNYWERSKVITNMGTIKEPLVFYLNGNLADPKSLVLTEEDMTDFMIHMAENSLPDLVRSELHNTNKCFLYLGFGLKYWHSRLLVHALGNEYKNNSSFAIEDFRSQDLAQYKNNVLFFREGPYRIRFFENSFKEFATELRQRYERSFADTYLKPLEQERRPKVFISHVSEDKNFATSLYRQLKEGGLDPWMDKENLRGGDNWDNIIKKVIKREIDYFLVLQSKSIQKEGIGYFFREINEARDRQKEFRAGFRFIIPLKIGNCKILEDLEDLQTFSIDTPDNITELIRLIHRDYEKRKVYK